MHGEHVLTRQKFTPIEVSVYHGSIVVLPVSFHLHFFPLWISDLLTKGHEIQTKSKREMKLKNEQFRW